MFPSASALYSSSDITSQTYRVYEIDYSRPGVVVIFNNSEFTDSYKYPYRHVSEQDVLSLCTLSLSLPQL